MKHKTIKLIAVFFILLFCFAVPALAETPYESYTHWSDVGTDRKDVYNRPMYEPEISLSADSIGVKAFKNIKNICSDKRGYIYILDSDSRIVILDGNYKLVREINSIGNESYNDAESIYVYSDNTIYICDTLGKRIIHISENGELLDIINQPESSLIPDDFDFRPLRIVRDSYGYLYVLSDGSYYGALLYGPDKAFLGFYGSNTVTSSLKGVLTNIKDRLFPNNVKKGNTARNLPYCFNDITIDSEDFIYTCNGFTDLYDRTGQIRKLSPGAGKNILNSGGVNFVDTQVNSVYNDGAMAKQDIMDVEVDGNGFVYALESAYGRIFLYDKDCRMLTAFGGGMGAGSQLGNFTKVSGMALLNDGERVLVSDYETGLITVFRLTEFGSDAKSVIALTLNGEYEKAESGLNRLIKADNNFQPAYSGLARVYLNKKDYANAMKYAKIGYDRDTYAVAFEYRRKNFTDENFVWIFAAFIVLAAGLITFLAVSARKKLTLIKNRNVNMMFSAMIHPANVFTDIKEKGYGSVGLCVLTLAIYYVVTVLQTLAGGFLFTYYDAASFNSFWVLIRSVGLVILWVAADWLICTLLGGKGKLKEIIIVSCYSLWPIIFAKLIRLVMTNILIPAEADFLNILDAVAMLYFLLLMIIGLLKIHDFSMSRLIGTSCLAIVGMAAIIFLGILIVMLIQQLFAFAGTFISEILTV